MHDLAPVDHALEGDSHRLRFTVTENDQPKDISSDTLSWRLFEDPHQSDPADAVLDDSDAGVEIVDDARVDTTAGEWEVRIDEGATDGLVGEYWHRAVVDPPDDTRQQFRGMFVIDA